LERAFNAVFCGIKGYALVNGVLCKKDILWGGCGVCFRQRWKSKTQDHWK